MIAELPPYPYKARLTIALVPKCIYMAASSFLIWPSSNPPFLTVVPALETSHISISASR